VIVATIGLSMGALSDDLFTMIVAMAILTTLAMPPSLRWALARLPLRKDEKQRLEREEMEAKGFVPNLERLLVAVDDSSNGEFATRFAGIVAGTQGTPVTVMHIAGRKSGKSADEDVKARAERVGERVQETAERIDLSASDQDNSAAKLDITTIAGAAPKNKVIAEEAAKGYDLLIIGLEKTVARGAEFQPAVTQLASGFEGPLAVVEARGLHLKYPLGAKLSILLPVNGTEPSRRAAEVAITLARATNAPITAVYVASRSDKTGFNRSHVEAILKDIVELANSYDCDLRTAVHVDIDPEDAIMKEIARRSHNLIVMGVARRPGDQLFFGETAAAVLKKSEHSMIFIAT
jgi:nucleotide-binding universal stress UspA family protein